MDIGRCRFCSWLNLGSQGSAGLKSKWIGSKFMSSSQSFGLSSMKVSLKRARSFSPLFFTRAHCGTECHRRWRRCEALLQLALHIFNVFFRILDPRIAKNVTVCAWTDTRTLNSSGRFSTTSNIQT